MIPLTVAEIATAVGGQLRDVEPGTIVTAAAQVDSRACTPGSLFVCVAGERVDGHDFVVPAVTNGAVVALTERPVTGPAILVTDSVAALGRLAAELLRRTPTASVTGITGSSGKTSTKDLLAAVLAADGSTIAPAGSFNNEVGLPLTVTLVEAATRHLVLEYSARGIGHIAYLTTVAPPSVAVVLNVGTAHLGEFGSRDAVARAKGELVEALPPGGTAILNADEPLVAAMAARTAATVRTFGTTAGADVRIDDLRLDSQARPRFTLATSHGRLDIALSLPGAHQATNAAAAMAAALTHGLDAAVAADALAGISVISPHRMAVSERADGLLVVDDAYNANPESMRAALAALARLAAGRSGAAWAVLGEMRELGSDSAALHADVGQQLAELGVDRLVTVGEVAASIAAGAAAVTGWPGRAQGVADVPAAAAVLAEQLRPADTVLVKASNSVALWRVADALLAADVPAGASA